MRALREGTYPPRPPLFASLIVGYACAYEERGSMGFLIDECKGYFDGFWDLSPGPLSCKERGEKLF